MLLGLLGITICASLPLSGVAGLAASLSIALLKSAMIYWRYMHLDEEDALNRIAALAASAWLLVLLLFLGIDYWTRAFS
ncbi:cytochrome C oxidase subunit IV family protein [Rhizobium sp. P28RR-XV]|uniref:cytochrome C oxidase subunit IV family protein n=1 Tax=Rhizobium sp. P28RR-XV TaxID=2726737 RepID=UPI0014565D1D|nr:cytochrome C oxidase subunit IV family protein [Rhizobium sp. P28RR-XV]NLR85637.1 caa(3)-type oxidase subunit IV [Rhizobium sp. P28RR-XV]